MPTHLIILAAGEGTRMASDKAKVLHEIAGAPMFVHSLISAAALDGRRVLVVGHSADKVAEAAHRYDDAILIAEQSKQLGTADAVAAAAPALSDAGGDTVILLGDTHFIRPETLKKMQEVRKGGADVVFLGFEPADPANYGRMITDGDQLVKIVEWKQASEVERKVSLCNSGVAIAETETLLRLAAAVENNNDAKEYYLTDIVEIARAEGLSVKFVTADESETIGVNTRAELAAAEAAFQIKARTAALENGVTLQAPDSVFFAYDTVIGRDAVIEQNVVFGPGVTVETGARIRAFSHVEGAHIGQGAIVGPYARIRPGTELSNGAKVGNFVEIKNAQIGDGAKVNHLSYIGDASVGTDSNIGAGTVTCNYDGVFKHRTQIGDRTFIGSNTLLVAPVTVGDEAMTATGSVITKDVPPGDLGVARAPQINKPGFAKRFFKKLRAAKAAQKKG
ncbi:MAG: bifunctional UDP-N-acetylglucosamine diphosphorylase/glucosamine-1-phosphate N-acetyltransferase GlmU [Boseongicola sp.]